MKRIIMLLSAALVMGAMMVTMAMPAFAAGGAAENCGPPGETTREYAKMPGSLPEVFINEDTGTSGPPGKTGVTQYCAPGQLK